VLDRNSSRRVQDKLRDRGDNAFVSTYKFTEYDEIDILLTVNWESAECSGMLFLVWKVATCSIHVITMIPQFPLTPTECRHTR
jgi:hypothetical protein